MTKINFNPTSINNQMQKGYEQMRVNNTKQAITTWLKLWEHLKAIMRKNKVATIDEIAEVFVGQERILDWAGDFEMELGNASRKDKKYITERLTFCSEFADRAKNPSEHNILNLRSAAAQCYFELGEPEKGEALFQALTEENPTRLEDFPSMHVLLQFFYYAS